jgi:hypothetical protein
MMESLHIVNDFDESVEVLASAADFVVEVKVQCDAPEAGQSDPVGDPFLDLYLRFTGVSEVDRLSWRTRSFEDTKIPD